jgi:hypothetical protein
VIVAARESERIFCGESALVRGEKALVYWLVAVNSEPDFVGRVDVIAQKSA